MNQEACGSHSVKLQFRPTLAHTIALTHNVGISSVGRMLDSQRVLDRLQIGNKTREIQMPLSSVRLYHTQFAKSRDSPTWFSVLTESLCIV